jgi:hypothetical protein
MLGRVKYWAAAATLIAFVAASAWAAVEATGKWTESFTFSDGSVGVITFELKQDGEKITGTHTLPKNTEGRTQDLVHEIIEGKITPQNDLSFAIAWESSHGLPYRREFKGRLDGDTIKGTQTRIYNGNEKTREWIATRDK